MKKYYIFFVLFLLVNAGCDDFLDRMNYTQIDEGEVFKTVENAQGALTGVYDKLSDADFYGRHIQAYEAAKGPDFFVLSSSGNRYEKENAYDETSSSAGYAKDTWKKLYSTVKASVLIINGIDQAEGTDAEKGRIKGEALALRGLTYFELMRNFAYPPIFSFPGKPGYADQYKFGVPVALTVEDLKRMEEKPEGRKDAKYCYEEVIVKDLSAARDLLKQYGAGEGKSISYPAVCALLSRVYLYMGEWEAARDAALDGLSATKTKMIDPKDYAGTYWKPFNSESVWELQYTETDNLSTNSLNYLLRYQTIDKPGDPKDGQVESEIGYGAYGLQDAWVDLVKEVEGDVRTYLVCKTRNKYNACRKYIGNPHYLHNICLVRLPELYLNLAEAYAELGSPDAVETLNNVYEKRTNKKFDATGLDKAELIGAILKERRKELVLEGHTFWDYFRRAIPFDREPEECIDNSTSYIDYTRPQVVYPIPEQEMDANPAIRKEQNPGYSEYLTN